MSWPSLNTALRCTASRTKPHFSSTRIEAGFHSNTGDTSRASLAREQRKPEVRAGFGIRMRKAMREIAPHLAIVREAHQRRLVGAAPVAHDGLATVEIHGSDAGVSHFSRRTASSRPR